MFKVGDIVRLKYTWQNCKSRRMWSGIPELSPTKTFEIKWFKGKLLCFNGKKGDIAPVAWGYHPLDFELVELTPFKAALRKIADNV